MGFIYTEWYDSGYGLSAKIAKTLFHGVSEFQTVEVLETESGGRILLLDGLVMTTDRDEFIYHEMISHIPLLAHPNPKRILVIGGGDGGTVREVLKHPSVERVVLCEIDGMVIDASREFLPTIAGKLDDPRVEICVGDGVAYIAQAENEFDVILVDSTDPIGPGVGLFTEGFYQNVLKALKKDGIMVAQSESPLENRSTVTIIYELLLRVFPVVVPYASVMPGYPGGYWSWAYCSKGIHPLENINEQVAAELEKDTQFYNRDIHGAVFALPNFAKALLGSQKGRVPCQVR